MKYLLLLFSVAFSEHIIPPEDFGPPYFCPANPDERIYKIPLAAGESTYISDSYQTDPKPGPAPDAGYTIDFDTEYGQMVYAARAGRVTVSAISGGIPDWYTVEVSRVDSILDSTSTRGNGWRLIQSTDMYRHLLEGSIQVNLGDQVVQGQPIGRTNNVGNNPHLHFQVMISYLTVSRKMVPTAFWDIRVQPQGFPERFETYVSQNEPIGIELAPMKQTDDMALSCFPNPFRASTAVRFSVVEPQTGISLAIFDPAGRLVETLLKDSFLQPGDYSINWVPPQQACGIYFCRLTAGKTVFTRQFSRD